MPPSTRQAPKPIPAALRKPEATRPPEPIDIHFTVLMPDERVEKLLKGKIAVLTPVDDRIRVHVHFVLDNPNHRAAGVDAKVRHLLIEAGLVTPDQVGFASHVQTSLGWSNQEERDT